MRRHFTKVTGSCLCISYPDLIPLHIVPEGVTCSMQVLGFTACLIPINYNANNGSLNIRVLLSTPDTKYATTIYHLMNIVILSQYNDQFILPNYIHVYTGG